MQFIEMGEGIATRAIIAGTFLAVIAAAIIVTTVADRGGKPEPLGAGKVAIALLAGLAVALTLTGFPITALAVLFLIAIVCLVIRGVRLVEYGALVYGASTGVALALDILGIGQNAVLWAALWAAFLALAYHAIPIERRLVFAWAGAILVLASPWAATLSDALLGSILVIASALVLVPLLGTAFRVPLSPVRTVGGLIASFVLAILVSEGLAEVPYPGYGYDDWPVSNLSFQVGEQVDALGMALFVRDDSGEAATFELPSTSESATIKLKSTGEELDLMIYRHGPGSARSMDLLAHSVRSVAEFMGNTGPFLSNQPVTLAFDDWGLSHRAAGMVKFSWNHRKRSWDKTIVVLPKYDVDDSSVEAPNTGYILAHEAAHYYWSGNENWLDEGAASILGGLSESRRASRELTTHYPSDANCQTLSELEKQRPQLTGGGYHCHHSLGERLFLDLYTGLGRNVFQRGFRNLHHRSEDSKLGIGDVRAAFTEGVPPEAEAVVEDVIARWYDGVALGGPAPTSTDFSSPVENLYLGYASGEPLKPFPAEALESQAKLFLEFSSQATSEDVRMEVVEYSERLGYGVETARYLIQGKLAENGLRLSVPIGAQPSVRWEPGRYWLEVSLSGRQVGKLAWQVAGDQRNPIPAGSVMDMSAAQ